MMTHEKFTGLEVLILQALEINNNTTKEIRSYIQDQRSNISKSQLHNILKRFIEIGIIDRTSQFYARNQKYRLIINWRKQQC